MKIGKLLHHRFSHILLLPLVIMGCGDNDASNSPQASSRTVLLSAISSSPSAPTLSSSRSSLTDSPLVSPKNCAWKHQPLSLDTGNSRIRLEAEKFDACATSFFDTDLQLGDSDYRAEPVDISADNRASGSTYVSHMMPSEYIEYSLSITGAGLYTLSLSLRQSAEEDVEHSSQVVMSIDGQAVGALSPLTTQWQTYSLKDVYFAGGEQTLRLSIESSISQSDKPGWIGLDFIEFRSQEDNTLSPSDIVEGMGIGINLGNTLDVPAGKDWGAQHEAEHYFRDFKVAGFNHVRIPVTWGGRTEQRPPYTVNEQWMARVEKTIDWALSHDIYVILNAHHEKWLKESYTDQDLERINAIWEQVAERFQNKPHRLLFEILNEPEGMTVAQVDLLNIRLLKTMRKTNPTRPVIFSGNGFTPYSSLLKAAIPDDPYLIGNYHNYDPWPFAGLCVTGWGTESDYQALRDIYQAVADWSARKNIPVTVNEFGAALYDVHKPGNTCSSADRLRYLKAHVELQKEMGIPGTVWDDDGSFRIYDRAKRRWGPALKSLIFD